MPNVTVHDNGAAYCICVNGLIVCTKSSLGDAWRHIKWMYEVASQQFTVGREKMPVRQWIQRMMKQGYMDTERHYTEKEWEL